MWVRKRNPYVPPHPTLQESFSNDTLTQLILNEQTANTYYGKRVRVYQSNGTTLEAKLSLCSTDSTITFEDVYYEQIDYHRFDFEPVQYDHIPYKWIDDILLMEHDSKHHIKSIKHEIFDLIKLKLVENILHKLTSKSITFNPFHIQSRKIYNKSSTSSCKKTEIANNILNIKIPTNPYMDPIITDALHEVNAIEPDISLQINNTNYLYSIYDALSLIHHYHQLWIQHIHIHSKQIKNTSPTNQETSKQTQSYIAWDQQEIESVSYTPKEIKEKTVYIKSFWPFYFHGPCSKSERKNTDWKCMRCNSASSIQNEKIIYYKSKRTDATVEICTKCVRSWSTNDTNTLSRPRCNTFSRPSFAAQQIQLFSRRQYTNTEIKPMYQTPPMMGQMRYCVCGNPLIRYCGNAMGGIDVCSQCSASISASTGFVCYLCRYDNRYGGSVDSKPHHYCNRCAPVTKPMPIIMPPLINNIQQYAMPIAPVYTPPMMPYNYLPMDSNDKPVLWNPMPNVDNEYMENDLNDMSKCSADDGSSFSDVLNGKDMTVLMISNVQPTVTKESLTSLFCPYGDVKRVKINIQTQNWLVMYKMEEEANRAKEALNGLNVSGQRIKVNIVSH